MVQHVRYPLDMLEGGEAFLMNLGFSLWGDSENTHLKCVPGDASEYAWLLQYALPCIVVLLHYLTCRSQLWGAGHYT